jgi:hypothetical protein
LCHTHPVGRGRERGAAGQIQARRRVTSDENPRGGQRRGSTMCPRSRRLS